MPASGGAGHQQDAVRQGGQLLHGSQDVVGEPQALQLEAAGVALVQDAHHQALPVKGGQGGDPQVDLLAQHLELDAAVLGQPALGDVQLGHQLEAGDDGGLQLGGGRVHGVQDAVDPVAHPEVLLEGLQVNVAGPALDRPGDHLVDHANHRDLGGHVPQLLDVLGDALGFVQDFARFLHRLGPLVRSPVEPFQGFVDLGFPAQAHPDLQPGEHAQGLQGVAVGGVGHGHRQHPVLLVQGQDPELTQKLGGELVHHQGHRRKSLGRNELGPMLGREGGQQVLLGEVSQIQQDAADLVPPLPLQGQAVLQLRGGDQVPIHQDPSDELASRHSILPRTG